MKFLIAHLPKSYKKEMPLLRGAKVYRCIDMKKKEIIVYKGIVKKDNKQPEQDQPKQSNIDREVTRAGRILYKRIEDIIRDEDDLTREYPAWIKQMLGKYAHTYQYPDGWRVHKILLPDRATKHGEGYHKIAIVESTAETEQGVSEAIRRGIEVKTKLEKSKAHITAETIIVLSHNISFQIANKLRVLLSTEHRKIFIYSVKNAIGVAKNALKKFANLFTIRARKIKDLPRLSEEMQILADTLLKRGEKLFGAVSKLGKALEMMLVPKRELRKARDAAWKYLAKARDWGVKCWISNEDWDNLDIVYDKINLAAQLQGIDLFEMEQSAFRAEAIQRLNQLNPG